MMDRSPRWYIPCFVEIGHLLPQKIFKLFAINRRGGHLGHVIFVIYMYINFDPPFLRMLHMNGLALINSSVSEENMFELYCGQR